MEPQPSQTSRETDDRHGRVLLLGGASGSGKTTLAKALSAALGVAWVQVDDLRLALQRSDVRLPTEEGTQDLYFFVRTPEVWSLPAERLRDGLVAVGEAMVEAIAVVAENHIAQNDPAVIEGDGILPALLAHPRLRPHAASGHLRAAFLAPASEDDLLRAMIGRGRGVAGKRPDDRARITETNWLFSAWLEGEARRRSLPVLLPSPRETLLRRAVALWDHGSSRGRASSR